MTGEARRLRMFAGPNGSGKSTLKRVLRPDLLGQYINPDEIEAQIKQCGFLNTAEYVANGSADDL